MSLIPLEAFEVCGIFILLAYIVLMIISVPLIIIIAVWTAA